MNSPLVEHYERLRTEIIRGFGIPEHIVNAERYSTFVEQEHPRHNDGKFRPKGSAPKGQKSLPAPAPDHPAELGQQEWDFKPEGGVQVKGETEAIRDRLITRRMDRAEGVTDEQYEMVYEARKEIISKLPRKMMKRVQRNLIDLKVHAGTSTLSDEYPEGGNLNGVGGMYAIGITINGRDRLESTEAEQYLKEWYRGKHEGDRIHMSGRLNIVADRFADEDKSIRQNRLVKMPIHESMRHVLAHELSHATDWNEETQEQHSGSEAWLSAASSEILDQLAITFGTQPPLTRYAMSSPQEAWAEFGRLVIRDPERAERRFPKCWKVWQDAGLI